MHATDAPILIVSADAKEAVALRALLGLHDALDSHPDGADAFLRSSRLGGMVIGASVSNERSQPLVREYAQHQPCGRIVVLARADVHARLAACAYDPARVGLFVAPWRVEAVLSFLGVEAGALA